MSVKAEEDEKQAQRHCSVTKKDVRKKVIWGTETVKYNLHYIGLTEPLPPVREGARDSCSPASEAFWLLATAPYLFQSTLIAGRIERGARIELGGGHWFHKCLFACARRERSRRGKLIYVELTAARVLMNSDQKVDFGKPNRTRCSGGVPQRIVPERYRPAC